MKQPWQKMRVFWVGWGFCCCCFSCFFALNQCFPWRAVHFLFSWKLFEWISPNCLIKRAADRKIKEPSKSSAESACLTQSAVLSISQSPDYNEGMISLKRENKKELYSVNSSALRNLPKEISNTGNRRAARQSLATVVKLANTWLSGSVCALFLVIYFLKFSSLWSPLCKV